VVGYRVTKYNPERRDLDGTFLDEDWTSVSDIGKSFNGAILSKEEYLRTENAYVETANSLISAAAIGSMRITDVEIRTATNEPMHFSDGVWDASRRTRDDQIVSGQELEKIVRGCLREYLWCRLTGPGGSYIHFGYDYYLYVGLPKTAKPAPLPNGIYLEQFASPYQADDE
jgi:hypothetical protein